MKTAIVALAALLAATPASAAVYEGNINGEFVGWDGSKVYELADGHVIKQTQYHYHYHYAYSPKVIIFDSSSGGLKMYVDGDDDQAVGIEVLK